MELLRTLQHLDPAVESVSFKSEYTGILFDGRQYRYAGIVSADPSYIGLFRQYIRRGGAPRSGECIVGTVLSQGNVERFRHRQDHTDRIKSMHGDGRDGHP